MLAETYEKLEKYDEALKTYKIIEEKGFLTPEIEQKIIEITKKNDEKLYLSENEDKKTFKSIKLSDTITYNDK